MYITVLKLMQTTDNNVWYLQAPNLKMSLWHSTSISWEIQFSYILHPNVYNTLGQPSISNIKITKVFILKT